MTHDEAAFFHQLGLRVAPHHKARGLTQAQLGERIDVAQQRLEWVSTLPKPDQRAVMRVLDSMPAQASR